MIARLARRLVLAVGPLLVLLLLAPAAFAASEPTPLPRYLPGPGLHTLDLDYGRQPGQQLTATWSTQRVAAPWLVTVHGGSWINGSRVNARRSVAAFAPRGFQVFNLEYPRGTAVTFEQQVASLALAHAWIVRRATYFHLDPRRGSAYGFSAGAHLVAELSQVVALRAVVSLSGVLQPQRLAQDEAARDPSQPFTSAMSSLYTREKTMLGCVFETGDSACAQRWRTFCPEYGLRSDGAAWYIVQGDADVVVNYRTAADFGAVVRSLGNPVEVTVLSGYGHTDDEVYDSPQKVADMLAFVTAHST